MSLGSIDMDAALDRYLTTEPEQRESKCKCVECGVELFPDEDAYELEGDIYCEEHAREWLENQRVSVTYDMAYED